MILGNLADDIKNSCARCGAPVCAKHGCHLYSCRCGRLQDWVTMSNEELALRAALDDPGFE